MFVLRRIYCRVFQLAFRAALPVLPYRNPKIIPSDAGIPDVLRKHGVGSVMIVTGCRYSFPGADCVPGKNAERK